MLLLSTSSWPFIVGDFTCEREGIFPDPDACANFIQCVLGNPGTNGGDATYVQYVTACPETTLFAECDLVCELEDTVDCGARPRPDGSVDDPDAPPKDCDGTTTEASTSSTTTTTTTTTTTATTTMTSTSTQRSSMSSVTVTSTSSTTTTTTTSTTTTTTTTTTSTTTTTTEEVVTPTEHPREGDCQVSSIGVFD